MNQQQLRRADFKTGVVLILFCLWFLAITFAFMPFRETYGGVENVWYVSPWIFPAVILTLLLTLSLILTINAVISDGIGDILEIDGHRLSEFKVTRLGAAMILALTLSSGAGLVYLVVNIEDKIRQTIEEAQWLADPSSAKLFSWSDPQAVIPLAINGLVFATALASSLYLLWRRRLSHRASDAADARAGEARSRFFIIALLFILLVYVLIPRIDFFVAIFLFLCVFTSSFHVEEAGVARFALTLYTGIAIFVAAVFGSGLDRLIDSGYAHMTDLIVIVLSLYLTLGMFTRLASNAEQKKRLRTCLIIALLTPLVLVPVFRFGLLVPLPHEGAVVELMHQIRYLGRE